MFNLLIELRVGDVKQIGMNATTRARATNDITENARKSRHVANKRIANGKIVEKNEECIDKD